MKQDNYVITRYNSNNSTGTIKVAE